MAQKRRSVSVSNTVYVWLEEMVSTGEYSDLDDAATDLLMQLKRGTHSQSIKTGAIQASTTPVPMSTTPVLASTHAEPIAVEPPKPSPEPTIAPVGSFANVPIVESPSDELARLQALPKFEKFKNMNRITELKELIEA